MSPPPFRLLCLAFAFCPALLYSSNQYEWEAAAMPERAVETGLEVHGIVEAVLAEEGALVEEGDVLLRLRARSQELAVREARHELERETVRRDHLQAKADRMEGMLAEDLVSREEYEDARVQAEMAAAAVALAEAGLALAEEELDRRVLRAPWSGHVLRISATEGGIVKALTPLAEMADATRLKAVFFLPPAVASGAGWTDRLRLFAGGDEGEGGAGAEIPFAVEAVDPFPDPSTERVRLVLRIDPATGVSSGDRLRLVLREAP